MQMFKEPGHGAARPVQTGFGRQLGVCHSLESMPCDWQALLTDRQILPRNVGELLQ